MKAGEHLAVVGLFLLLSQKEVSLQRHVLEVVSVGNRWARRSGWRAGSGV